MIIGFDLSTRYIGIAIVNADGQRIRSEERKLSGQTLDERMRDAIQIIGNLAEAYDKQHFAIEAPFVGRNGRTSMELGKMAGIVHGVVGAETGRPVLEITPAEAKLAMTGKGNADKALVQQMARARFALESVGEHEADALAVCLAASVKLHRMELEGMG